MPENNQIIVIKMNPKRQETWRYAGQILAQAPHSLLIEAFFNRSDLQFHDILLKENDRFDEGEAYIKKAHEELMRKFKFIPEGSKYRKSFMNMKLHQKILDEGKKFQ